jgi:hypothetical protein
LVVQSPNWSMQGCPSVFSLGTQNKPMNGTT